MKTAGDNTVAGQLIAMARADNDLRDALAGRGVLFGGYHPEMRALHEHNAQRLLDILQVYGWPVEDGVGREASEAAWLIAQHAISKPHVMRAALRALEEAAANGRASKAHVAHLEDRIALFEGRAQRYGTQFDWNDDGMLAPQPIADAQNVDARRAAAGLVPLAVRVAEIRKRAADEGDAAPRNLAAYRAAANAFARDVGWR